MALVMLNIGQYRSNGLKVKALGGKRAPKVPYSVYGMLLQVGLVIFDSLAMDHIHGKETRKGEHAAHSNPRPGAAEGKGSL